MANFYLVTKADGTEEVTADFYERQNDDWAFVLGGQEIYRVPIEEVVSVAKAPRDVD